MAVLLAPWIGLLLGLAFAWFARDDLARSERGPLATPALLLAAAFGLLVLGPATGYYLAYAPDWSFAYLVDSQRLPAAAEMLALLISTASPMFGFVLAARTSSRRDGVSLLRWAVALVVVVLVLTLVLGHRFATEASYAQYHGAFGTRSVAGGDLGLSLLWINLVVALCAGWVIHQLKRLSRGARD